MIQVNEPIVSQDAKDNINEALDTAWLSSSGKFVKQFEEEFAEWLGVRHAVAVSSGTAALHLALLASGIGKGDEVIVPAFTMGSVWLSVLYTGAKPVFVDASLKDWNIGTDQIKRKINSMTKAIMAVHTYGMPCAMDEIRDLADKHNLKVIEDACEAMGALYKEKKCGTFGDISCFSFFANKLISTGEGGMAITDDSEIADKLRKLRDLCHSETRFIHDGIGYNYRMTNLQAAIGCGELKHIGEYMAKKTAIKEYYDKHLQDINGIEIQTEIRGKDPVCWMYPILIDKLSYGMDRDELKAALQKDGIETRDFFYPPEDQPILKGIVKGKFLNAIYLSRNGLYLPSGLALTEEQMQKVVGAIKKHYKPMI